MKITYTRGFAYIEDPPSMSPEEVVDLEITAYLRDIKCKQPRLRMGQIILNAIQHQHADHISCPALFYMTDDQLLHALSTLSKDIDILEERMINYVEKAHDFPEGDPLTPGNLKKQMEND